MAKRRSARGSSHFKVKLKQSTIYSIGAVLLISLGLVTWLSFTRKGLLLVSVNDVLLSQVGIVSTFFLPFVFIVGGLMLTKLKIALRDPKVFLGSLVCLTAITGLSRGGQLGDQLWVSSASILSPIIAGLFLVVGLSIGIIIMLDIPIEDIIAQFSSLLAIFKRVGKRPEAPGVDKSVKVSGMTASNYQTTARPAEIKTTGLTDKPTKPNLPSSTNPSTEKAPYATSTKTGKRILERLTSCRDVKPDPCKAKSSAASPKSS
jgi:hypothetical protein